MEGTRDLRLELAADLERQARARGPGARCEECGELLPRGVDRTRCVVHSDHVQGIVRELLRRERAEATPGRRVA